jgi:hypothetical protein
MHTNCYSLFLQRLRASQEMGNCWLIRQSAIGKTQAFEETNVLKMWLKGADKEERSIK